MLCRYVAAELAGAVPWEALDECLVAVAEQQCVYCCAFPPKGLLAGRGGWGRGKREKGVLLLASRSLDMYA